MVSKTAQACAAAKRGRLVFSLPWLLDHTVPLYCPRHVWPWGGLDQSWVKVKRGGGREVYFWLGTVLGWFAEWALGSAREREWDCIFHHEHQLALCNCKARWSRGAAKPLPNLLSRREQASTHDYRNGSAVSDRGVHPAPPGSSAHQCIWRPTREQGVKAHVKKQ